MSRVLVGVTDGVSGGRVLAWALREAVASSAPLVIVRGATRLPEALVAAVARGSLPALEQVDAGLARAVAAARHLMGPDRVSIVIDQAPAGQLLVGLARFDDLLVVGAPSHAGWWGRGSTTYHVITHAFCPVVVVRSPQPPSAHTHVVVELDGSPAPEAAVEWAREYARTHGLGVQVAGDDPQLVASAELLVLAHPGRPLLERPGCPVAVVQGA